LGLTFAELTDTKIGPISFAAGDRGLTHVYFGKLSGLKSGLGLSEDVPSLPGLETVGALLVEMNEYLFGIRKSFSVDLDWAGMVGFQRIVLEITATIPFGAVMTYGEIARQLGQPKAARAVGTALGANPMPIVIPCHRVIGSDHLLHGYAGGLPVKSTLLTLEGLKVENDLVVL